MSDVYGLKINFDILEINIERLLKMKAEVMTMHKHGLQLFLSLQDHKDGVDVNINNGARNIDQSGMSSEEDFL